MEMDSKSGRKIFIRRFFSGKTNKQEEQIVFSTVWELYHRYFSGKASKKDKEAIENISFDKIIPEESEEKTEAADLNKEIVWNGLSKQFGFDVYNRKMRDERSKHRLLSFRKYAAVAAILFLLIGSGVKIWINRSISDQVIAGQMIKDPIDYQTGNDSIHETILPDGSVVFINRNSKLKFSESEFNKKQREVWLEGEAFFQVAKNPDKAFIIHTGEIQTEVKGTSFNVKAYKELKQSVVSVRSGIVEVTNGTHTLATLTRNTQLTYDQLTQQATTEEIDGESAAAWTSGNLVLYQAGVEELRMRFMHYFGVEMNVDKGILQGMVFNASFPQDYTLEESLTLICELYQIRYTLSDNNKRVRIHQ